MFEVIVFKLHFVNRCRTQIIDDGFQLETQVASDFEIRQCISQKMQWGDWCFRRSKVSNYNKYSTLCSLYKSDIGPLWADSLQLESVYSNTLGALSLKCNCK